MRNGDRRGSQRSLVLRARARVQLWAPTPSEERLWSCLRGGALGVCFRRQVVVGGFIADFLAPSVRLVVEVDGAVHALKRRSDERRDRKLRRLGYHVLRLEAELVMRDLPAAVACVREAIEKLRG
jgi:histidinol dehydrogenase/leucyl-tRNA synthetase/ATP-dependent DNA helicase RecG